MATVNFSVPEAVKQGFDETFKGRNQSAIIADLMCEAIERVQYWQRHRATIYRILERHKHAPSMTDEEFRAAREEGRS